MQRNPDITESQWHGFKTLFRNEWWQWSEEKRKQEIRVWMIRAHYLVEYEPDEKIVMVSDT